MLAAALRRSAVCGCQLHHRSVLVHFFDIFRESRRDAGSLIDKHIHRHQTRGCAAVCGRAGCRSAKRYVLVSLARSEPSRNRPSGAGSTSRHGKCARMKNVIFACVHNAGRSQIAAAWFQALSDRKAAQAISAGTQPANRVHGEVITAMKEAGIDLSFARPQLLTEELARGADMLVTMGCDEACPIIPGIEREDWPVADQGTIAGSGSRDSRRHSSASYGDARRKKLGTKITRAIAPHVFTNDAQMIPRIKAGCLPSRIARLCGASLIQRRRELSGHSDSIARWRRHFQWDESFPPLHRNA